MSNISQFFGGSHPVGSIAQFPFAPPDSSWLYCDNSKVVKATYPELSALYPSTIGTLTGTTRTPTATPSSNAGASNGTVWALAGAVGPNAIYTTSDGITYTARTTPGATDVRSILWLTGTRWVAAVTGSAQPLYSSNDAVTWVAATGATAVGAGFLQSCMAYSSTLGSGSGRICMAVGSTSVYTSDDYGQTYTDRATGLGAAVYHVCWTGSYFVATTATGLARSADGITWAFLNTQVTNRFTGTNVTGVLASDGQGRIALIVSTSFYANNGVVVSQDHGETWYMAVLPVYGGAGSDTHATFYGVSYTNGRFIFTTNGDPTTFAASVDLKTFVVFTDRALAAAQVTRTTVVHRSGGVYLFVAADQTWTSTWVEDTTKMYIPGQALRNGTIHQQYIKVRS